MRTRALAAAKAPSAERALEALDPKTLLQACDHVRDAVRQSLSSASLLSESLTLVCLCMVSLCHCVAGAAGAVHRRPLPHVLPAGPSSSPLSPPCFHSPSAVCRLRDRDFLLPCSLPRSLFRPSLGTHFRPWLAEPLRLRHRVQQGPHGNLAKHPEFPMPEMFSKFQLEASRTLARFDEFLHVAKVHVCVCVRLSSCGCVIRGCLIFRAICGPSSSDAPAERQQEVAGTRAQASRCVCFPCPLDAHWPTRSPSFFSHV